MTTPPDPTRRRLAWWLLLVVALAAGAFLRIWQLGIQILIEDEWHAIHKLLDSGMLNIATHFGGADYCIPLTLYYRALYDLGWLTEWSMRLPLLIAGLLLLAAPLLMRRLALPTRAIWTALLALSPVLIYLTRTARPYALTCLLTGFAVIAIERWWRGGPHARRWGAGYAVATALAAWLNLLTLAFTLLPFLWFGLPALWRWLRARGGRPLWSLVLLGLATLLPMLVLLLPPLINDWGAMSGKAGLGRMSWLAGWRTLQMAYGNAHGPLVAGLLLLSGYGAWRLWRQHGAWLAYLLCVGGGGTALIIIAEPNWIQSPPVLMRYALPALPLLLLALAEGVAGLCRRYLWPEPGALLACGLLAWLFYSGPLPLQLYYPNQYMAHMRFQYSPAPLRNAIVSGMYLGTIPDFYRQLAELPPHSVTVAEGPWRLEARFNPMPWYQQLDGQYRKIAMITPVCGYRDWGEYQPDQHGIHLTQFVHLGDLLAGRRHGVDFLVLHMQPWVSFPPQLIRWPDMPACLARVKQALGPPIYRDQRIAAFDLRDQEP